MQELRRPDQPIYGFKKGSRFGGLGSTDKVPGPEEYNIRTQIGGHNSGGEGPNAPSWGMGSSTREDQGKVFISQRHTLTVRAGTQSPGPIYNLPTSVGGKQADARVKDSPCWGLSGAKTPDPAPKGRDTPGPVYEVLRGIGKIPDSRFKSEPVWGMRTKARPPVDAGDDSPGPCVYDPPQKRLSGAGRFSKGARFAEHDRAVKRAQRGEYQPGPGTYG